MDNFFNRVPWNLGGNRLNCKIFQWNLSYFHSAHSQKTQKRWKSRWAKFVQIWIHRGGIRGYRPHCQNIMCPPRRMLQGEVDCSPDVCFGTVVLGGTENQNKGNRWVWEGNSWCTAPSCFIHNVFMMCVPCVSCAQTPGKKECICRAARDSLVIWRVWRLSGLRKYKALLDFQRGLASLGNVP